MGNAVDRKIVTDCSYTLTCSLNFIGPVLLLLLKNKKTETKPYQNRQTQEHLNPSGLSQGLVCL